MCIFWPICTECIWGMRRRGVYITFTTLRKCLHDVLSPNQRLCHFQFLSLTKNFFIIINHHHHRPLGLLIITIFIIMIRMMMIMMMSSAHTACVQIYLRVGQTDTPIYLHTFLLPSSSSPSASSSSASSSSSSSSASWSQRTLKNTQRTPREHTKNTKGTPKEDPENTQTTLGEHTKNTRRTLTSPAERTHVPRRAIAIFILHIC